MENNQNPTVYNAPQSASPPKRIWFKPKYILFFLLGIVIVEIIIGAKTLLTPLPAKKVPVIQLAQPVGGAKLLVITPKTSYKVGENIEVIVRLVTTGHPVIGTDIELAYDPNLLESSRSTFLKGQIYDDYPYVDINTENGVIKVSGIASTPQKAFNGIGIFGTVNLKAKASGKANIKINNSNVIDAITNQNILEQVSSLEVNIK